MRRFIITVCLVHLALAGVQAQSQHLKVWLDNLITVTADSSTVTTLKVYQTDPSEEYTSFNMSIVVPKGIKIHKAEKGYDVKLGLRGARSHVIACSMPSDTLIKVACMSVQNENMSQHNENGNTTEELFTIALLADKNMQNGDYDVIVPSSGLVFNGRSGDTYVSSKLTEDITATIRVSGGMESSISSVKHKKSDGIYDMHGRKVVRKAKHGVYIEDGKKVLE